MLTARVAQAQETNKADNLKCMVQQERRMMWLNCPETYLAIQAIVNQVESFPQTIVQVAMQHLDSLKSNGGILTELDGISVGQMGHHASYVHHADMASG